MATRFLIPAMMMSSLMLVSACMPSMDMQGVDPRDYYAAHPIKNKVVAQTESHVVLFEPKASKPSKAEVNHLRDGMFDKSLLGAQKVEIQLTPADMRNTERKASLRKMLKYMGYRGDVTFATSDVVVTDQALVMLTFATVVPPNCPDWRMSPVHNYSNHSNANFGCATEVNLGQMVADPRDLERGTGELPPALSERGDMAMRMYRTGGASTGASAAPAAASSAAPAANASAAPSAAPQ